MEKIFSQTSKNLPWLKDNTILLVKHGSVAYGTNTPESDEDFKGVCIPPKKYYLGATNKFEQTVLKEPDTVIYEINKFIELAAQNNPNIIEVLFTDLKDHVFATDAGKVLLNNKEKFLSKRIKFTFSGYAISQLKRIKLHRKWLLNPVTVEPKRSDFGLPEQTLIPQDQLMAANAEIQKQLDRFNFDFMSNLDEASKIEIKSIMTEMLSEMKIYSDEQWSAMARKVGMDENFILLMAKERQYSARRKEYENYKNWETNRNPKRASLEAKYGYDCYVEETEFLTKIGWKKYENINETDELATINKNTFKIEYQNYSDKFKGSFTGNLYNLYGNHLDVKVTPNHRMFFQKEERNTGAKYDWCLEEAANLPDTFNILRTITPNFKNYKDNIPYKLPIKKEAFLRLVGWYLSDGTVVFYKNKNKNKNKEIRISQKLKGKLSSSLIKFSKNYKESANCSLYIFDRKPNSFNKNFIKEMVLSVRNKELINFIINECSYKYNKRIPRWVYDLSFRSKSILLDALIKGDGTIHRPDNSIIYYSKSKNLADDVQELALMCGYETSLYGPYEGNGIEMYHVHINKTREQFKKCIRSKNIKKEYVENKNVVCFTVPNSTLVTRLNGHIGFHGNSKHAYHLVRLMRMCAEVLSTGDVIVKRPDYKELLEIRNGAWSYDYLIGWAEDKEKEINELYLSSKLPHSPDREFLDNLCIELVEQAILK